jgi:hypothetical protein
MMKHNSVFVLLLFLFAGCEWTATTFLESALVLATAGLVWATFRLARYTKALSNLTDRLVHIEAERDERETKDKRLQDFKRGLDAAKIVQKIHRENFNQLLNGSFTDLPFEEMDAIETLWSLQRYMSKIPNMRIDLEYLCNIFDGITADRPGTRKAEVVEHLKGIQDQIHTLMNEFRREIASGG